MKVLILSQYYKPEPIPKPSDLAEELVKRGHIVSVVTGFPNYPSGCLYSGYRLGLISGEKIDSICVTRTYEFPYHGKSPLGRILNYGSFMLSAPLGCLHGEDFDVIYVWHPPLTIGLSAWVISALRGVPFVYDVQDIWPEGAVIAGLLKEGPLLRIMCILEKFIYRRAGRILVVTQGARENLISKGVPPAKIVVMPHWVDDELFENRAADSRESLRRELGWDGKFIFLFAGNLGMVQGLDTVVEAAGRLENQSRVLIVLMGGGADKERLEAAVREKGLTGKVRFLTHRPMCEMPGYLSAADAVLVHLKKSDIAKYSIPAKTLAYMAAGKPILMAMEGAAPDLVERAGAGIVIPPDDPMAMAAAISSMVDMAPEELLSMGLRGRDYFVGNLSRRRVIPMYEEQLKIAAGVSD